MELLAAAFEREDRLMAERAIDSDFAVLVCAPRV